jgi:hypothetical protein
MLHMNVSLYLSINAIDLGEQIENSNNSSHQAKLNEQTKFWVKISYHPGCEWKMERTN